jgi:hypothetical protein
MACKFDVTQKERSRGGISYEIEGESVEPRFPIQCQGNLSVRAVRRTYFNEMMLRFLEIF